MYAYFLGVLISLTSSTVESVGYCMLRLYHLHQEGLLSTNVFEGEDSMLELPCRIPCEMFKRKPLFLWLSGILCVVIGNALDFVSLGITKESVVTIVGSWSLVVTAFLAPLILGETLTRYDMGSCVLIMFGIICTVVSSSTDNRDWSIDRILAQYQKPGVIAMVCFMFGVTFLCVGLLLVDYSRRRRHRVRLGLEQIQPPDRGFIGFVYCFLAAFVGNFTVVLGKANSVLLFSIISGTDDMSHPLAYVLFFVFLVFLPFELWLIDASLSVNDSLYHVPMFYVCWIIGSIVTGAVFYDEMSNFTLWRWCLFFAGVCILLCGVGLINQSSRKKRAERAHHAALYESEMFGLQHGSGLGPASCAKAGACKGDENDDGITVAHPVEGAEGGAAKGSVNESRKRRRRRSSLKVCSDEEGQYETADDVSDVVEDGVGCTGAAGGGEVIVGVALQQSMSYVEAVGNAEAPKGEIVYY